VTRSATPYVLWVTRDDADDLAEDVLRERAGAEPGIEVRTEALRGWNAAKIPAGSRDESGTRLVEALHVWANQLPPEGRVYLIEQA
jgi:hypothetical protein